MATFIKINDFVADVHNKVHNLGADQLAVALSNTAPASEASNPTADGNGILANVTEITYTGLSSRNITTNSSTQTGGTYELNLADLVLTASGNDVGPFRYVYIYNSTAAGNPLIGVYDRGSSVTIVDTIDSFTVDFSDVNGLFQTT